jgi:hypothetical protein
MEKFQGSHVKSLPVEGEVESRNLHGLQLNKGLA